MTDGPDRDASEAAALGGSLDFWPVWEFKSGRGKLARYVAPGAVAREFGLSVELSREEEGDPESSAARADADRLRAERLYERLRDQEIRYGLEPWASSEGRQQIRHPWWLLNDHHGTCVDIAATYAGMCLQSQVGAMLAVTEGHAFVVITPGRLHSADAYDPIQLLPGFRQARVGERLWDEAEGAPDDMGVQVGRFSALQLLLRSEGLLALDVVEATNSEAGFAAAKKAIDQRFAGAPEGKVWLVDVPFLHGQEGFTELDQPPRARPSIRMWVGAPGGHFEDFPAHREIVGKMKDQSGVVALVGESGRGKSTIARRQAERAKFGAAWFLDASDRKALLNSFAMAMQVDLGRPELKVPEVERKALAETALAQLAVATDPWLVVLDNADEDPTSIRDLLPVPKEGQQLLITSTNEEWIPFLRRSSLPDCRIIPLPPVDAREVDRFDGEEIAQLVNGRPLLIDAFRKLDPDMDWGTAAFPPAPGGIESELQGPAVYWSLLRTRPKFGEAELEVAAFAALMPANAQPVSMLAELVDDGESAVEFLTARGLLSIDHNLGIARMHRLFSAAIRADLETEEPDLCDRVVRLLTGDDRAKAALDEHGDLATVTRLDERLNAIDGRTVEPDPELGVSLHGVAMLFELHGHTRRSGLTFERAERHLMDDLSLRADCLLGRARTINQHHKKDQQLLEEAIGWSREARDLKLACGLEGPAYRALAMEGLLMRPLANFSVPGKTRKELLDGAQEVLEEADDHRQRLPDEEVPPAEKARSRYNLAGVRIPKAQESPARAAEHLEIAERIYSEVATWRAEIYGRMVHPHIAACINGLAIVAYYRAILLPAENAQRTTWLRKATEHANEALKQREVLDGSVDADEASKSASLLAKIVLARSAPPPEGTLEDAADVAEEAMGELGQNDRLPPPVPSFPTGPRGLLEGIDHWARSRALLEVVGASGELPPDDLSLSELLEWLDRFSDRWDFRRGERDIGTSPQFTASAQKVVEVGASALGLVARGTEPKGHFDVVLILGGLARACLSRPLFAARAVDDGALTAGRIVAIGAFRDLSEGEIGLLADFEAESVGDEFAAMDFGARHAFGVSEPNVRQGPPEENPNAAWRVHEYTTAAGISVEVAAAPSAEPEVRRANTADTLTWLLDTELELKSGQRLLIVTTDIYVPFQHAHALRLLALPFDVEVEVAGVVPGLVDRRLAHEFPPDKFLQEIRSTIRSLRQLESALSART